MVLGIPLFKLAPLAFKVITKPFVDALKRSVRKSPFWKDHVFVPMARKYNKTSVKVRLWSQGITRSKEQVEKSAKLSEEAALELGAEIVANTATFTIGIIAILMQQSIAAASEKRREEKKVAEERKLEVGISELQRTLFDLGLNMEQLDARLRELNRTVVSMDGYGKVSAD